MIKTMNGIAWMPVDEARRPGTEDEIIWGTLQDAIQVAHDRVERLGCRQRVRVWSPSHASHPGNRLHYFAIQSH